jgi:hypothetical protein
MATLRASEIGSYLYCNRAWWYQRQGLESANQAELNSGTKLHQQHGRKVLTAGLMVGLAYLLLVIALLLLVAYFTALII